MRKFKVKINSKNETMVVSTKKRTPDKEIYTFNPGDAPSWNEQAYIDKEIEAGRWTELSPN